MSSAGLPTVSATTQAGPEISGCISDSRQGSIPAHTQPRTWPENRQTFPAMGSTTTHFPCQARLGSVGGSSPPRQAHWAPTMLRRSKKHMSPTETATAPKLCYQMILKRVLFSTFKTCSGLGFGSSSISVSENSTLAREDGNAGGSKLIQGTSWIIPCPHFSRFPRRESLSTPCFWLTPVPAHDPAAKTQVKSAPYRDPIVVFQISQSFLNLASRCPSLCIQDSQQSVLHCSLPSPL